MLQAIERMGNQLPPRLKALLNLAISAVLLLMAIPVLSLALADGSWADASFGLGLFLLSVFNLFT